VGGRKLNVSRGVSHVTRQPLESLRGFSQGSVGLCDTLTIENIQTGFSLNIQVM
jgi:hypothetical protein